MIIFHVLKKLDKFPITLKSVTVSQQQIFPPLALSRAPYSHSRGAVGKGRRFWSVSSCRAGALSFLWKGSPRNGRVSEWVMLQGPTWAGVRTHTRAPQVSEPSHHSEAVGRPHLLKWAGFHPAGRGWSRCCWLTWAEGSTHFPTEHSERLSRRGLLII